MQDTLMTKHDEQGRISTNYVLKHLPESQANILGKIQKNCNVTDTILIAYKKNRSYKQVITLEEGNFIYYVNYYNNGGKNSEQFFNFESAYKFMLQVIAKLDIKLNLCVNKIYNIDKNGYLLQHGDTVTIESGIGSYTIMSVNNGGILQITDGSKLYNVLSSNVEKVVKFQPIAK